MSGTNDKPSALTEKEALDRLADLLWPGGDAEAQWAVEALNEVAEILRQCGRFPNGTVSVKVTQRQRRWLLGALVSLDTGIGRTGIVSGEVMSCLSEYGGFPSDPRFARKELEDLRSQLFKASSNEPIRETGRTAYVVCVMSDNLDMLPHIFATLEKAEQAIKEDMEKLSHLKRINYCIRQVAV